MPGTLRRSVADSSLHVGRNVATLPRGRRTLHSEETKGDTVFTRCNALTEQRLKQMTMPQRHDRGSTEPVSRVSANPAAERIDQLRLLFPDAVTEGRIDLDRLRDLLGEDAEDRLERYSFTWAGKRDAIRLLAVPSRATLVPDREASVDFDTSGNLFITLEDTVRLDALTPLGLTRDDLFVCRDSALDDETAANLALQCRLKTI